MTTTLRERVSMLMEKIEGMSEESFRDLLEDIPQEWGEEGLCDPVHECTICIPEVFPEPEVVPEKSLAERIADKASESPVPMEPLGEPKIIPVPIPDGPYCLPQWDGKFGSLPASACDCQGWGCMKCCSSDAEIRSKQGSFS